jgi:hypothetical protein
MSAPDKGGGEPRADPSEPLARPLRSISGSRTPPVVLLEWSPDLGKRVRRGPWVDQAVSTTRKVEEAIDAGQWELVAQLVDYWMEEAKVVFVIYTVWTEGFETWLLARGVPQQQLKSETERLARLLSFPAGEAFDPGPRWEQLAAKAGVLANLSRAFQLTEAEAKARLDELRESWRQLHDRGADMMSGLLSFVATQFGEAAIENCYRFVLEPYLQERYQPFDLREQSYEETIYRNLYLAFEAMRGHLCGPDRTGDLELEEHHDRWVIRFDPCGSGNRSLRGDEVESTGSRAEPPYSFGVTKARYDWAWNEEGICYYCAHCCFALERWPAEQWGHPLRVIDSPRYPSETDGPDPAKCSWTIYKSIDAIPEDAYVRIGMKKPNSRQGDAPDVSLS